MTTKNSKITNDKIVPKGHKHFAFCILHFKFKKSEAAFTLLETVVTLAIITAAVVGPLSLITRGLVAASFSKNKVIAANLAQEGIELVRVIRENNILCGLLGEDGWTWRQDYNGTGNLMGNNRTIDATQTFNISCNGFPIENPVMNTGTCNTTPLKVNDKGEYGYSIDGIDTTFTRCIDISQPPSSEPSDTDDTPPIDPQDMLDVVSTVSWNERGVTRNVQLRTRLYNWR